MRVKLIREVVGFGERFIERFDRGRGIGAPTRCEPDASIADVYGNAARISANVHSSSLVVELSFLRQGAFRVCLQRRSARRILHRRRFLRSSGPSGAPVYFPSRNDPRMMQFGFLALCEVEHGLFRRTRFDGLGPQSNAVVGGNRFGRAQGVERCAFLRSAFRRREAACTEPRSRRSRRAPSVRRAQLRCQRHHMAGKNIGRKDDHDAAHHPLEFAFGFFASRCTNEAGGCSIHQIVAPIAAAMMIAMTAPAIVIWTVPPCDHRCALSAAQSGASR